MIIYQVLFTKVKICSQNNKPIDSFFNIKIIQTITIFSIRCNKHLQLKYKGSGVLFWNESWFSFLIIPWLWALFISNDNGVDVNGCDIDVVEGERIF